MTGKMIVFEGADGAGKTTQVNFLVELLAQRGFKVVKVREPGGTKVGEAVRSILLSTDMEPLTELMLFTSSRIELVKTVILPALARGEVVVCDRFTDSTMAYQGYGRGLLKEAFEMTDMIHKLVVPDHVLFLDLPVEESIRRLNRRAEDQGKDRLDALDLATKERIYQGFQTIASWARGNNTIIDANQSIQATSARISQWAEGFMRLNSSLSDKGACDA